MGYPNFKTHLLSQLSYLDSLLRAHNPTHTWYSSDKNLLQVSEIHSIINSRSYNLSPTYWLEKLGQHILTTLQSSNSLQFLLLAEDASFNI